MPRAGVTSLVMESFRSARKALWTQGSICMRQMPPKVHDLVATALSCACATTLSHPPPFALHPSLTAATLGLGARCKWEGAMALLRGW